MDIVTKEWIPKLKDKFSSCYDKITVDSYREIMDKVKVEYLRDDIVDHIHALLGSMQSNMDALVVSHNDIQENNILSMRRDATELAIIDYEYTSLGNREFDLANIFCELMMDNAFPYYPFIALYTKNALSQSEYSTYSTLYLSIYHKNMYKGDLNEQEYIDQELPVFMQNLYCSMILNGYYWGIWSILMINGMVIF